MTSRFVVIAVAALACSGMANGAHAKGATELPAIKTSAENAVPACATPGRLQAYLKSKNGGLDQRYTTIATDYMRHGEAMQVRWDFAFFQMMLETGNLSYKNGNRPGDVRLKQNNFAGIGATGGGVQGETFPDISTGVKAHIEHLRLYAADPVANPVADRTRKVAEWGVLTRWQKGMNRPVNFRDLAKRWAVNASYANDIQTVADRFFTDFCDKPDPEPQLMADAKGNAPVKAAAVTENADDEDTKPTGKKLAERDAERGRKEGRKRNGLGMPTKRGKRQKDDQPSSGGPDDTAEVKADKPDPASPPPAKLTLLTPPAAGPTAAGPGPAAQPAAATPPAKTAPPPAGGTASKCNVWTASYGGQRAVIIRSSKDGATNYTVLDVHEGAEKREAEAYIKAYATGGEIVAEFPTQNAALDKAFELCPEG